MAQVDSGTSAGGNAGAKIVIKATDMAEQLQSDAQEIAVQALKRHDVEKEAATMIKKEFDKKHGRTWHCVVGKSFGSYFTHEVNSFIYFYVGSVAVLLFKAG